MNPSMANKTIPSDPSEPNPIRPLQSDKKIKKRTKYCTAQPETADNKVKYI